VLAGSRGDAETFWTGFGAIRRGVFAEAGFDRTAQPIEDIELGYRVGPSATGSRSGPSFRART
jgi:hypothetical protein